MVPDWKALLPHRPLDPSSDQYVPPPSGGAERIAEWILADRTTVLVAGPVGIGKSTELARAAHLMQLDRVACLIRLDRFENMRRATADQLLLRIAGILADETLGQPFIQLSRPLVAALEQAGVLTHDKADKTRPTPSFVGRGLTLLNLTLAEVASIRNQRFALILDGLEKMPDGPTTLEFFESLGMLPDTVDIVAVLPWSLAFGIGSHAAIRGDEHLLVLRTEDASPPHYFAREFLAGILARRLQVPSPPEFNEIFLQAAAHSGGVPRTFLQLVADAGTYARIRRKAAWPNQTDLADAIAEQRESFRRLLRPGDTSAIQAAVLTDGRELELERRIRLLTHGVLLEQRRGSVTRLVIHPLLDDLIMRGEPYA